MIFLRICFLQNLTWMNKCPSVHLNPYQVPKPVWQSLGPKGRKFWALTRGRRDALWCWMLNRMHVKGHWDQKPGCFYSSRPQGDLHVLKGLPVHHETHATRPRWIQCPVTPSHLHVANRRASRFTAIRAPPHSPVYMYGFHSHISTIPQLCHDRSLKKWNAILILLRIKIVINIKSENILS